MNTRKSLLWAVAGLIIVSATASELWHHHRYGDFFGYGPHIDIISANLDLGSGVQEMFAAKLTNYGLLPISFDRVPDSGYIHWACDGFIYHARIERLVAGTWQVVDERSPSRTELQVSRHALFFGQSICAGGWYPLQASGDEFRFVIVNRFGPDGRVFTSGGLVIVVIRKPVA